MPPRKKFHFHGDCPFKNKWQRHKSQIIFPFIFQLRVQLLPAVRVSFLFYGLSAFTSTIIAFNIIHCQIFQFTLPHVSYVTSKSLLKIIPAARR